jgi:RimJ/RimL family protein N-acetyltransferase
VKGRIVTVEPLSLDHTDALFEAGREMRFAILDQGGSAIGSASFCDIRPENRAIEIGWTWLTPSAWGRGANAETKLLLLRHAFEVLGCHWVEFHPDERSRAGRAADQSSARWKRRTLLTMS